MAVRIDFDADFDEQAAQARAQRVMLPNDFYRLPAEKRAQAFTVSGLARLGQVQAVADALAKFQADGGTFEDFRKWAAGQDWSLPRHRLETIYRNAVQTAYMAGHWRRFDEVKEAFPYLMYDAINDSRVRPSHLAMDGVIRPVDDPIWKRWTPPVGHRCFLPGTRVRGNFRLGSKMFYAGPAVEFWTASGARLAVTANHPILTEHGFIAASELCEGMDCLSYGVDVKMPAARPPVIRHVNDQQPPASVEDVFDALASYAFGFANRSTFDLHGDAVFGQGDVHVAGSECHLMHGFKLESAQGFNDFKLIFAGNWFQWSGLKSLRDSLFRWIGNAELPKNTSAVGFGDAKHAANFRDRESAFRVELSNFLAQRIIFGVSGAPCRAALALDRGSVSLHRGPFDALSLALPARLDAVSQQEPIYRLPAHSVLLGKRIDASPAGIFINQLVRIFRLPLSGRNLKAASQSRGILLRSKLEPALAQQTLEATGGDAGLFAKLASHFPGEITRDKIVGIRHFTFRGHVYDFETEQGWLFANGIVASNCRCTLRQMTASEAQRRGGVTQSIPAEAVPDEGWGNDPREWSKTLRRLIDERLSVCSAATLARKVSGVAIQCLPAATKHMLMARAATYQGEPLPPPKQASADDIVEDPQRYKFDELYGMFVEAFSRRRAAWMDETGLELMPDRGLFIKQDGGWKIGKNSRSRYIKLFADTLADPAIVRLIEHEGGGMDELAVLGRYRIRGRDVYLKLAYRWNGRDWEGWSAFAPDAKQWPQYASEGVMIWRRNK
jgi:SPP1 gp7 family putative phage head morphogenesis protein